MKNYTRIYVNKNDIYSIYWIHLSNKRLYYGSTRDLQTTLRLVYIKILQCYHVK